MSDPREPPAAPGQVIQIAAVSQQGETDAYVTLFALCDDGTIWRMQEFDEGVSWQQIPSPQEILPAP